MPFLRDEGPPIPQASIQRLRESLPTEYGWAVVNETGREVLVVRVPKAKPDYLHDLAEVAFYIGLESVKTVKDVLLIGHEKTARLEPQLLRDHIRAQAREDGGVVDHLRRQLDRQYGHTFVQSPSNHQHNAFSVRIPKETVAQFTPEDVTAIRQLVASLRARVMDCQYAYVVANADHERLGRRVLLELIGEATAPALVPVAEAPAPAPPPAQAQGQGQAPRIMFPSATPSAAAPAAPAQQPIAPAYVAPSIFSPPPAATPVASAPVEPAAAEVTEHEEYTIVSKPKAPAEPAHAPAVLAEPASAVASASDDEYEIVSKPKATAPVPAAEPESEPQPEEGKKVLQMDKEFEVFTSKPKPKVADSKPAITPPGMGGFQAALHGSTGPAPARTKEYEIMGRTSVTSDAGIASKLRLPSMAPAPAAASPFASAAPPAPLPPMTAVNAPFDASRSSLPSFAAPAPAPLPISAPLPPRVPTPSAPADNGAPMVMRVAPAAPELVLAQRFRDAGYEVVEGLRAQGTTFAFAAHKPNGRRVLVKRSEAFAAEDAAALAQLVAALGADVALVVADNVKPGTRLATWGTRIEVVTPADVPSLGF